MGIGASSEFDKIKPSKETATLCVICYENDIKLQRLDCGHTFCYDCIASIHAYEVHPRCPLCRQYIGVKTTRTLHKDNFNWFKVGRKVANSLALTVCCCLFCYHVLPTIKGFIPDFDLTMMHGLLNNVRIEYDRVKETLF